MLKLQYYLYKFKNLPAQGSDHWLEGRMYSFGGSEMATVINQNDHETWDTLKSLKTKRQSISNDATEWGRLFEKVAKHFIQKDWGTTIYEFGSIPHPYYPVCYSPDGLMVIQNHLVLLEIKTPIKRGIKKIPHPYYIQVQTGLSIISATYSLFAQFRFRRCKLTTSSISTVYDRKYHLEYKKRQKDMKPKSFGYFLWDVDCGLSEYIDLAEYESMGEIIKTLNAKTVPKCIIQQELLEPYKGAILMWKLFEEEYNQIDPKKNFLEPYEDLLWKRFEELRHDTTSITLEPQ